LRKKEKEVRFNQPTGEPSGNNLKEIMNKDKKYTQHKDGTCKTLGEMILYRVSEDLKQQGVLNEEQFDEATSSEFYNRIIDELDDLLDDLFSDIHLLKVEDLIIENV